MSSLQLVQYILRLIVPALFLCTLFTILRAWTTELADRRQRKLMAAARKTLVVAATTSGTDLAPVRDLPPRVLVRALTQIARSVSGPELGRIRTVADHLGIVRSAERLCTSPFWWRRLYGARVLTQLGTNNEVVPALVFDRNAVVRAQVAVWVAVRQDTGMIENLIELVYDPVAYCRFAAKDALLRLGGPAVSPVAERLRLASGAEARPLLEIAAGIPNGEFVDSARRLCSDPDPRTRAAAADALGAIGGNAAIEELTRLLTDVDPATRTNAARAIGRIEHWPSATQLSALLGDDVWEVRSTAAHSLRMLGAPGELVLRRVAREEGTVASDVAKQALDMAKLEHAS